MEFGEDCASFMWYGALIGIFGGMAIMLFLVVSVVALKIGYRKKQVGWKEPVSEEQ